jgi:hypothetical protein
MPGIHGKLSGLLELINAECAGRVRLAKTGVNRATEASVASFALGSSFRLHLKRYPQTCLQSPRVGDDSHLFECLKRICRISTTAEVAVQRDSVYVIEQIESFDHGFNAKPLIRLKCAAKSCIHVEEIKAGSRVATDE